MSQVVLFGESNFLQSRSLAIYKLATHLRQHNITVQPIWAWRQITEKQFKVLCYKFIKKDTMVVGLSATMLIKRQDGKEMFFGIPDDIFAERINLIKSLAPGAKIVVGGSQISHTNLVKIPNYKLVDYFLTGQGEEVLRYIVDNFNSIKTTSITPPTIADSQAPYETFHLSNTQFTDQDVIIEKESVPLELARGCIFKCSYCSFDLNGKTKGDYIKRPPTLREELLRNYETLGIQNYYICDDLINDSEEKVDAFLGVTQSLPFKISYSGYLRLDLIHRFPTMAAKLRESGLVATFFGVETINDRSGRAVGKGLGLKRISNALAVCKEAWKDQVVVEIGIILGLPYDTPETKHELLNWLDSDPASIIKLINVKPLFINAAPGSHSSDVDKNPGQFGYTVSPVPPTTKSVNWQTKDYSLSQAVEDCNHVTDQYYKNTKFKDNISIFNIPYLLSLTEYKTEFMNTLLHDTPGPEWQDSESWLKYLTKITATHRALYLDRLLRLK